MPQIHLGVYLTSGHETVNAVKWALEVRIDLVPSFGNCIDMTSRQVTERNGGKFGGRKRQMTDTPLASIRLKCIAMNEKLDLPSSHSYLVLAMFHP